MSKINTLNDKNWLHQKYVVDNLSCAAIGRLVGSKSVTVSKYLKKYGFKIMDTSERFVGSAEAFTYLNDKEWLLQHCDLTLSSIAKLIGTTHTTVSKYFRKHGLKSKPNRIYIDLEAKTIRNKEWLIQKYEIDNLSQEEIANQVDCDKMTVSYWIRRHGLKSKPAAFNKKHLPKLIYLDNKDWLYEQYKILNKSTIQIGKELKCTEEAVSKYLKKHNISIDNTYHRSNSECELVKFVESAYKGIILTNVKITPFSEIDIVLPNLGLAIEYYGDLFHANPKFYTANDYIKKLDMVVQEIWDRNNRKKARCEEIGLTLIIVWEYDWINRNGELKEEISLLLRNR